MSDNIPNTLSARQAEHDPNFMLSLARGLEVLNAFTPQRQRLTISQLSQKTQISRAAVRRCLYTLAALGMVHSPDGRSYELLPRVLAVGHAYLAGTPLAKVAQTALDNLGKALGESCSAATLDGDNVLYIARAAVNNLLSIDLGRGDGSVAATIAPTAVSPRWRGCARSRRPAAEAIHPPSPAPGYEPE